MSLSYKKYKYSGIDWLGDLPHHWGVKRVKDVFRAFGSGSTPTSANETYYEGGIIPWLNTTDLNNGYVFNTKMKITAKALKEVNLKIYPENSLAMAMYGQGKTRGTVGLMQVPFTSNQASCIMYRPYRLNTKYILYWFIHKYSDIRSLNIGATQPNMNQDFVRNIVLHLPPLSEQNQISKYLDSKVHSIERKVEILTTKIEYYKLLRKSIINQAVSKGLDRAVKCKECDLGFPIPKTWKVHRLKDLGFLYSGLSGKGGDDFMQDNHPNNKGFIPFTNIANNTYLKADHLGSVVVYNNEKQNKVKKGDLFFLMSSEGYEDVGKSAVLAEEIKDTYLNSFCKGYRITNKHCEPNFLNYILLSDNYRKLLIVEGKGFTRINLKMEKVTDFSVYLPPTKREQVQIAKYLDDKTKKIDDIVFNIEQQIERLKELHKTLINHTVTGKLKVINN